MTASRAARTGHTEGGLQTHKHWCPPRREGNGGPKVTSSYRQRTWVSQFPRSLHHVQQRSHRILGGWRFPHWGHSAPESPGPSHTAHTGHGFLRTLPAATTATWLLGLSVSAHGSFPFCSNLPKQRLGLRRAVTGGPPGSGARPSLPAQFSEGLEIQLLDFLLTQPVANSLPFQKGLHLPPRAGSSGPEEIAHRPSLAARSAP